MTEESSDHETPNGGVKSTIYYRAADGSPAEKEDAVAYEILEFDADGENVGRTYGTFDKPEHEGE